MNENEESLLKELKFKRERLEESLAGFTGPECSYEHEKNELELTKKLISCLEVKP